MFRVKKGYLGIVSTKGYLGDITKAPEEVLEDLYHKNHIGVEFIEEAPEVEEKPAPKAKKKKKVDKAIDNAKEE